jgi:hypothetical protein
MAKLNFSTEIKRKELVKSYFGRVCIMEAPGRNWIISINLCLSFHRILLPKTRKAQQVSSSPFRLQGDASADELQPQKINSSIPPGAHGDMYRVVT